MSTEELRASRARLAAAEHRDRRRLERALHDDTLQALIALSVRLQLLRGLVPDASSEALELLEELQGETREALERLRALASDVYPSILDARGLPDALRAAARAANVDARIEAVGIGRRDGEREAAIYFSCRALLRSLPPGGAVSIELREVDGATAVEILGARKADIGPARDLIEAAGGSLTAGRATVLISL